MAATLVLELRGSESEYVSPCVGSLRGTAWGSNNFSHQPNPHWFLQPEVVGTYLPGTGTLGWGAWCGVGTSWSSDIPPKFLSTICGCGTSPFCLCVPLASLNECAFFNSTVVRLPFNSISESSEWWLLYILVDVVLRRGAVFTCAAIWNRMWMLILHSITSLSYSGFL